MKSIFAIGPARAAAALLVAGLLTGCTTSGSLFSSDPVDYRSKAAKTKSLDVPPDLTQLAREGRYQPQSSVVSAADLRAGRGSAATGAAPQTAAVAPTTIGSVKLMREGNTRWLLSSEAPEKVYPLLRSFWNEHGFGLEVDSPELGVMETDWAENRARLPQDIIRRTLGKVFDSVYSTGERDKFRTRLERVAGGGTEIYIAHRGLEEVFADKALQDRAVWQPRARDLELEAEFLRRVMVRLGDPESATRTAGAVAPVVTKAAPTAAMTSSPGAASNATSLTMAEGFDRAWRQVGLALDRSGFTVEDRDRSSGLYFVRYIDPRLAGKEEPNFFQKLFSSEKDARPVRYRVLVKSEAQTSVVSVQNSQGQADTTDVARQIIARLSDDLRR